MPRSRASYVKPVQVVIPAAWRERVEACARLMDRSPTYWINLQAESVLTDYDRDRGGLQSALYRFTKPGAKTDRLNVELPGGTVDAIRRTCGRNGCNRFLRFAIARGLGEQ